MKAKCGTVATSVGQKRMFLCKCQNQMTGKQLSLQKGNPCDVISETLLCLTAGWNALQVTHARFIQMWLTHRISEWMEDFCSMNASAGHSEPSWHVSVLFTMRTIRFNNDRTGGKIYIENTAQGWWGHGKPGNIRENIWKGKSHGLFYNKCTFFSGYAAHGVVKDKSFTDSHLLLLCLFGHK